MYIHCNTVLREEHLKRIREENTRIIEDIIKKICFLKTIARNS